ncbi:MAG: aminotransferase class IV [Saprospiraceae bacterium]|jgi:4-amino-4-deoxychorismate lyase|nr:aminotransferase class IV [Saprospiraceae bacterium]
MSLQPFLLESIRLHNGHMPYLKWHLQRIYRSRKLLWGLSDYFSPYPLLEAATAFPIGIYKVRLVYSDAIHEIDIIPYAIRPVLSLQLIDAGALVYDHKYADRSALLQLFQQRGEADDVLMYHQERITDSSYANVAFYDGATWYTPSTPLLQGVQRSRFIAAGLLSPLDIKIQDIGQFQSVRLINAMMTWEESPLIPTLKIFDPR